ncbi:MAG: mannose-1-phosphate guanylyltransferase, partial [Gammaproteobacteria bacterium]
LPLLGVKPFIVVNADVWSDYPYAQLPANLEGLAHLVLIDNPPQHVHGDFVLRDEYVFDESGIKLTFSGIGIYRPELFAACKPGKFPLAPLLRAAMEKRQITGEHYQGAWFDIGTPERLRDLDQFLNARYT